MLDLRCLGTFLAVEGQLAVYLPKLFFFGGRCATRLASSPTLLAWQWMSLSSSQVEEVVVVGIIFVLR